MVEYQVPQIRGWLDAIAVLGHMVMDRQALGHNRRVAHLCVQIGRQMAMTTSELRVLARAGLLHDIGKLAIPEQILGKHSPLNQSEWTLMKSHPEIGLSILGDGRSRRELLAVLYHHERLDGSGYPDGLKGEAISLEARIVAVADVIDAMASHRPYRPGLGIEAARQEIRKNRCRLYDPAIVDAALAVTMPDRSIVGSGRVSDMQTHAEAGTTR